MFIKIDSSKRVNGRPSKCSIVLNQQLQKGKYLMKSCLIPISYYNINEKNNQFKINDQGVDRIISVPLGFYTISTLIVSIRTALNLVSSNVFTFVFSSSTEKITISSTNSFTIKPASINSILGLDEKVNTVSIANVVEGVDLAGFVFPKSFNFKIEEISSLVQDVDGVNSCCFTVPISLNTSSIQLYEPYFELCLEVHSPLKTLNITICDDDGFEILLKHDYYFLLKKVDGDYDY